MKAGFWRIVARRPAIARSAIFGRPVEQVFHDDEHRSVPRARDRGRDRGRLGPARLAGGSSPAEALLALVITAGYAFVITLLSVQSETVGALAGRLVDERWEHINL